MSRKAQSTLLHPTKLAPKRSSITYRPHTGEFQDLDEYNLFTQAPLPTNTQKNSAQLSRAQPKSILPSSRNTSTSYSATKRVFDYESNKSAQPPKRSRNSSYDLFDDENLDRDEHSIASFDYVDDGDAYDQYDTSFDVSSLLSSVSKRSTLSYSGDQGLSASSRAKQTQTPSVSVTSQAKTIPTAPNRYARPSAPLLPPPTLTQQQNTNPNSPLHARATIAPALPLSSHTASAAAPSPTKSAVFSSFSRAAKQGTHASAADASSVPGTGSHPGKDETNQSEPPVVFDGSRLVPLCAVEASHRSVFAGYDYFNIVQSTCFNAVYKSDDNCVVSAPTGCGKTGIFELAILRTFRHQIRKTCGVDAYYSETPYVYDRNMYLASFRNPTKTYNADGVAANPIFKNKKGESVMHADAGNAAHVVAKRGERVKAIYICPLKALCEERYQDWRSKFSPLGLRVEMITGDTGADANINMDNIDLVVTTPEKWDSMTRRWNANRSLNGSMDCIGLMLLDEVHVLGEERGACLEGTVTRCKMVRDKLRSMPGAKPDTCCGACDSGDSTVVAATASMRGTFLPTVAVPPISAHADPATLPPIAFLRIVAVSATIPNLDDIGKWLQGQVFSFGKEYRPVPLQLIVRGYPPPQGNNSMYRFVTNLGYKVFDVLTEHSSGRPALIFCPTRKDCFDTATHIVEAAQQPEARRQFAGAFSSYGRDLGSAFVQSRQQRERLEQAAQRLEPKLAALVRAGVGVHSAGLHYEHRLLMESLFRDGVLLALCTTSTLAQGVNLPAHLVVIKGTQQYIKSKGFVEYQPGHVIQMMGRAGRPQFDTVGKAVILTSISMRATYERLDERPVCSTFAAQIGEHLNAELVLRTVRCQHEAQRWAVNTYCHVTSRLRGCTGADFEREVSTELQRLREYGLVEDAGNGVRAGAQGDLGSTDSDASNALACDCALLRSSALGEVAARFYLKIATTQHFIAATKARTAEEFLDVLVLCEEYQNVEVRMGEKGMLNALNKHAKKLHSGKQCAGQGDYFNLVAAGRELSRSAGKDKDDSAVAATGVRYPLKRSQVSTAADKIRLLLQCAFGEGKLPSHELVMDTETVRQGCARLSGALSEWLERKGIFSPLKWSLLFRKAADAKMWAWAPDNFTPTAPAVGDAQAEPVPNAWAPLLLQLDGIGAKYCEALAACGVRDFASLQALGPGLAEVRGIRDSSLWNKVQNGLRSVPEYRVDVQGDPSATGRQEDEHWVWLKVTVHQCKENWVSKSSGRGGTMILVGDYRDRLLACHCWRPRSGVSSWTVSVHVRKGSMVTVDVIDKVWVGVDVGGQFTVPGVFIAEEDPAENTDPRSSAMDASSEAEACKINDAEETVNKPSESVAHAFSTDDAEDDDNQDWSFGDVDDAGEQADITQPAAAQPQTATHTSPARARVGGSLYKRRAAAPASPSTSANPPPSMHPQSATASVQTELRPPSAYTTYTRTEASDAPICTSSTESDAGALPSEQARQSQPPATAPMLQRRGLYNRRPATSVSVTSPAATVPRNTAAQPAPNTQSKSYSSASSRAPSQPAFAPAAKGQNGPLRAYLIKATPDKSSTQGHQESVEEADDPATQAENLHLPLSTPSLTAARNNVSPPPAHTHAHVAASAPAPASTGGGLIVTGRPLQTPNPSSVRTPVETDSTNSWLRGLTPTSQHVARAEPSQPLQERHRRTNASQPSKSRSSHGQAQLTAGVALLSSLRHSSVDTGVKRLPPGHVGSVLASGGLGQWGKPAAEDMSDASITQAHAAPPGPSYTTAPHHAGVARWEPHETVAASHGHSSYSHAPPQPGYPPPTPRHEQAYEHLSVQPLVEPQNRDARQEYTPQVPSVYPHHQQQHPQSQYTPRAFEQRQHQYEPPYELHYEHQYAPPQHCYTHPHQHPVHTPLQQVYASTSAPYFTHTGIAPLAPSHSTMTTIAGHHTDGSVSAHATQAYAFSAQSGAAYTRPAWATLRVSGLPPPNASAHASYGMSAQPHSQHISNAQPYQSTLSPQTNFIGRRPFK